MNIFFDKIAKHTEEAGPDLDKLSTEIYEKPELGYQEFFACDRHVQLLKKNGFKVQENLCGIETGFSAAYTAKKPGLTVAFLAEYDALPGIGHGCGHNLLGAISTGAGIALKGVIEEIGGTVLVIGTPAEETSGAKVPYTEQGVFDNVDFALMIHPAAKNARSGTSLALEPIEFEFFGKTAHAAACPEEGINALDAAINTFNGINAMRQQIRSDSRVHGVIIKGGEAANIIPDYTKVQFYVRSKKKTYNKELLARVIECAKAGAQAAGARMEMNRFELPYDNLVTNEKLSEVFTRNFSEISGQEVFPPAENTGSVDAGQVSQKCPMIHPYLDITQDTSVAGHSRELANATQTPFARQQMRYAMTAMAVTAAEIMTDPQLFKAIRKEFDSAVK